MTSEQLPQKIKKKRKNSDLLFCFLRFFAAD